MTVPYCFGEFSLDPRSRTLRRGGHEINLGERSFGVLKLLVENSGRVVGRQELIDGVWPDVAVTDDSLARAVSDLRAALGDDSSHPRYIRTIHRQGYVFVAPVTASGGSEPATTAMPTRPGHVRLIGLVLFAAAVLAVASFFILRRANDDTSGVAGEAVLANFADWRLRSLGPSAFTSTAIKPSFSKTSNILAVVAPDPDTGMHSIFLLRPDGGEPLQLTRDIEVRGPSPEFSADDSHILFTSYRSDPRLGLMPDVWMAPLPAGDPIPLVEGASAASTSPDGRDLVYAAVASTGTSIRVRHQDGSEIEIAEHGFWPRWSPDGNWIAYTTSDPEGGEGTLHAVRPNGADHRRLTDEPIQHYGLCWTADSERVIFGSEQGGPTTLWSVGVTGAGLSSITRGPGVADSPTMSADGRQLVFSFSHRRWHLHLAPTADNAAREILVAPGIRAAAVSPDGSRIAIVKGAGAQSPAVSIMEVDTMDRRTISGLSASSVAWMPDGQALLVVAPAPDPATTWIWRLPIAGGLPEPILATGGDWRFACASPDGTSVAAVRRLAAGHELVVLSLAGGAERVIARKAVIETPRWSPDGRTLAWSGTQRPEDVESGGVWVCPLDGGPPRRVALDGAWPVWQADGAGLFFGRFIEHRGIWRVPASGGTPQLVRDMSAEMEDLYLEGLDTGQAGRPMLFTLAQFTGELYALEPPAGR